MGEAALVFGISGAPNSDTITLNLTLEEIRDLVELRKMGIVKSVERGFIQEQDSKEETEQVETEQEPMRRCKTAHPIRMSCDSDYSVMPIYTLSRQNCVQTHDYIEI